MAAMAAGGSPLPLHTGAQQLLLTGWGPGSIRPQCPKVLPEQGSTVAPPGSDTQRPAPHTPPSLRSSSLLVALKQPPSFIVPHTLAGQEWREGPGLRPLWLSWLLGARHFVISLRVPVLLPLQVDWSQHLATLLPGPSRLAQWPGHQEAPSSVTEDKMGQCQGTMGTQGQEVPLWGFHLPPEGTGRGGS